MKKTPFTRKQSLQSSMEKPQDEKNFKKSNKLWDKYRQDAKMVFHAYLKLNIKANKAMLNSL